MKNTESMRNKKKFFYLKISDPGQIDTKYDIKPSINSVYPLEPILVTPVTDGDHYRTKITDLPKTNRDDQMHYSFLDESKKDHQCVVTMRNILTKEDMPINTSIFCFWCRHSFSYRPIGCPIDYVPHRITKRYYSEITKDDYILRENMTPDQVNLMKMTDNNTLDSNYELQDRNYYLMDGLFCSFNCVLAFIQNQVTTNPLYLQSENFLRKIYYDVFGYDSLPLLPAPSWRLLKTYGGHMTIDEFRKNFYKVEYNDVNNVVIPFPNSKPVGMLFEKQIKL